MIRSTGACAFFLASVVHSFSASDICRAPAGGAVAIAGALETPKIGSNGKTDHGRVTTHVACAATEDGAKRQALEDCRASGINGVCQITSSLTRGCGYSYRGQTPWSVGYGHSITAQRAYDTCHNDGLNCDRGSVVAGCVGSAPMDSLTDVVPAAPVTSFAAGATGVDSSAVGGGTYGAIAEGATAASAESIALQKCEGHRKSKGYAVACTVIPAVSGTQCVVIAFGENTVTGQSRVNRGSSVEQVLRSCNTGGFKCTGQSGLLLKACANP